MPLQQPQFCTGAHTTSQAAREWRGWKSTNKRVFVKCLTLCKVVLRSPGRGLVSYERGTPVVVLHPRVNHLLRARREKE